VWMPGKPRVLESHPGLDPARPLGKMSRTSPMVATRRNAMADEESTTEERHYYELTEREAVLLDRMHRRLVQFREVAARFVQTQGDGFDRHDAQEPAAELVSVLRRWLFR
jgi:hypothetical protein